MFEVTPGSLNTPFTGIFTMASPLKVRIGTVGSFVMTTVLSTLDVANALEAV